MGLAHARPISFLIQRSSPSLLSPSLQFTVHEKKEVSGKEQWKELEEEEEEEEAIEESGAEETASEETDSEEESDNY